jgi:cobalt-zinc-cadmium resistance protein CzcA
VVIGGLFTATILTMIVLPVLYKVFETKQFKKPNFKKNESVMTVILFLIGTSIGFAQNSNPESDRLVELAMQNNKSIKAAQLKVDKSKSNINSAFSFDKTNLYYSYDQNNLALNSLPLKVFGVQQRFAFPTVYGTQKKVYTSEYEREKAYLEVQKNKLALEVAKTYNHIVYLQHQEKLYHYLDSLYANFSKASDRRFELGETNYLEKITAQAKFRQIRTKRSQIENEKKARYDVLQSLLQSDESIVVKNNKMQPLNKIETAESKSIYEAYLKSVTENYESQIKLQKQYWLPDLNMEYFQGSNKGMSQSLYGFQLGISVPILFSGQLSKTKVAKFELESWEQQKQNEALKIDQYVSQKNNELRKYQEAIDYYNLYGKKLSDEIIKVGNSSYKHGEIDFFQYIQSLENATTIQAEYLENVLQFNTIQLDLQYLNF